MACPIPYGGTARFDLKRSETRLSYSRSDDYVSAAGGHWGRELIYRPTSEVGLFMNARSENRR